MGDKFCFTVKSSDSCKIAAFKSSNGEDYYVKYTVTNLGDISFSVEWTFPRQTLVKVELCTEDMKSIISKDDIVKDKQAIMKFCDVFKPNDGSELNFVFVVSIVPFIEFEDCPVSSEENDYTIHYLTEDMLIGLAVDMRDLLLRGDMSDAVLTNGNLALSVHSAILSARSRPFHEILTSLPPEGRKITVEDTSDDALNDMAMFIYSGITKIKDMKRAEELYKLANKFEIEDLREICSIYLSDVSLDSVLDTFVLAEKFNDLHLKKSCITFIVKNHNKLKKGEKWTAFSKENYDLVSEIFGSVNGGLEKSSVHGFLTRFVK